MKKLLLCLLLAFSVFSWAQQEPSGYPQQFEGDWNVPDFTFHSGEKLAQLRLHYITLGSPVRDGTGHVSNAILILHGTGGRSEEHTSELQSRLHLVCRLLLEKKKKTTQ